MSIMKKKQTSKRRLQIHLVNIFGTIGYMFLLLQWGWVCVIYLYPLIKEKGSLEFLNLSCQDSTADVISVPSVELPSWLSLFIGLAVTLLVVVISIIVVVRLPKNIGKTGAKITKKVSSSAIPIITKHKPISEKKRQILSARIIAYIKLAASILPIVFVCIVPFSVPLPSDVVRIITAFCGTISLLFFGLQYLCAALCKIPFKKIW